MVSYVCIFLHVPFQIAQTFYVAVSLITGQFAARAGAFECLLYRYASFKLI